MSLAGTLAWLAALDADVADAPSVGLSAEGWCLAWALARDTVSDQALTEVSRRPGAAHPHAVIVAARGVSTAALEWIALLLARGSAVTLKPPRQAPGLAPWWLAHAQACGLPLSVSAERESINHADLVVVMGDDDTVTQVRRDAPAHTRVLGFGHRFSLAYGSDAAHLHALVRDHVAHDTAGCMAPALWLCPDVDAALEGLPALLDDAQRQWPLGEVSDASHAQIRSRDMLAAVTGRLVRGEAWRIHVVPPEQADPVALPRCVQLVRVTDAADAARQISRWRGHVSALACAPAQALMLPNEVAPRQTTWGELQRPPLDRHHDGVDHLRQIIR